MGRQYVAIQGTNHRRWAVLTVLTFGLAAPFWFRAWVGNGFR